MIKLKKLILVPLVIILLCSTVSADAPRPEDIPTYVSNIHATSDTDQFIVTIRKRGSDVSDKILDLSKQTLEDKSTETAMILEQPIVYQQPGNLTENLQFDQTMGEYYWSLVDGSTLVTNCTIPSVTDSELHAHDVFVSSLLNRSYLFMQYGYFTEVLVLDLQTQTIPFRMNLTDLGLQEVAVSSGELIVYEQIQLLMIGNYPVPDIGSQIDVLTYDSNSVDGLMSYHNLYASKIFDYRTDSLLVINKDVVTYVNYTNLTKVEFLLDFGGNFILSLPSIVGGLALMMVVVIRKRAISIRLQ